MGIFKQNYGIVNLDFSKRRHWVYFNEDCCFDSYGCTPPGKLLNFMKNRCGICIYSEYQIQKSDSFSGSYTLYIIYSTKLLALDFKPAVLNL